jgi:hypothetical protein
MVGSGVVDYGWLGIMPISISKDKSVSTTLNKWIKKLYGFRSKFSHEREHA